MATEVPGGWASPIHTKATTKKTPYAYRSAPPKLFAGAIRANAGGTIHKLARRGQAPHGASQIATPATSAAAQTVAVAARFNPGAGSGSVTSPRHTDPR